MKNLSLFDDQEIAPKPMNKTKVQREEKLSLPVIPLAKKKASKDDPPIEKEIRRFNRLIKELHEYEEGQKKKQEAKEYQQKLYVEKVLPELKILSELQLKFVLHLQQIFESAKFTKPFTKKFISFVMDVLEDAAQHNNAAKDLLEEYFKKQMKYISKKDKKIFLETAREDGFNFSEDIFEDFDVNEFQNKLADQFDLEEFAEEQHARKKQKIQESRQENLPTSITDLYKELAKKLHPDLEQDLELKHHKEQLMKELTEAKEKKDLYTMLVIQHKTLALTNTQPKENGYSLKQLKLYNKFLKEKVDQNKYEFTMNIFSSIMMNNDGLMFMNGVADSPKDVEQKIDFELKDIAEMKKNISREMKLIHTPEDLKGWLEKAAG